MKKQNYQLDQLNCGLSVLRVPSQVGSVFSLVLANTGSRYEKPEEYGVAHFFEHMAFKGTKNFPTAKDLAMKIDGVGADCNAFTGQEYTGYYIKAASRQLDLAQQILAEMMLQPILAQEEIDKERGVILEEKKMYIDSPQAHISNMFSQMMYKGSGLEHDIVGLEKTINNIQRADFVKFLQTWYGLDNLLLVLAGDEEVLMKTDCLTKLDQIWSQQPELKRKKAPKQASFWEKEFEYGPKLHLEHRPTEQAHFVLGWPGLKIGDSRQYAAILLRVILGGNMSSRLFTEVREKRGLCYYVRATSERNLDSGCFGAQAGVNLEKIDEALLATLAEFQKIASDGAAIGDEEFERAREFVLGQTILSMEQIDAIAEGMGMSWLLEKELLTPAEKIEKLKKVTKAEVLSLAKELFVKDRARLAIIGPYEDKSRFEHILSTY